MSSANGIYDNLSAVYNFIMRDVDYKKWSEYIYLLVKDYITEDAKVLELASGNCKLAAHLKKHYSNLTATDISKKMLVINSKNKFSKVCCSMTALPFNTKFDLIFSTFDSINYLTTKKSLVILFRQVKNLLAQNGIFTFDVSLEKNSLKYLNYPAREGKYRNIKFKQQSQYNRKRRIHKNIFEIELSKDEITTEIHNQKIHPFETYFELLEKEKLYVAECYEAFSFDVAYSYSERAQFIVKKIE